MTTYADWLRARADEIHAALLYDEGCEGVTTRIDYSKRYPFTVTIRRKNGEEMRGHGLSYAKAMLVVADVYYQKRPLVFCCPGVPARCKESA